MPRIAAIVATLLASLVLFGCTPPRVARLEQPDAVEKRPIPAGSDVAMRNGLTITVPAGWEATLTVDPEPEAPLMDGEYLLLENWDAAAGPMTLMVFSSSASTLPVSSLDDYGNDSFSRAPRVGEVDLYVGKPDTPHAPKRLMAARTALADSELGVLYFAGNPDDPPAAIRTIWALFGIQGASVE